MGKSTASKFFKSAQAAISKHSPEILIGLGIAGMVSTTVLAVKATPKALRLIEEKKKEKGVEKLTPAETVKATWKCYIPAAISGVTSTACLIGACSVNARRNAAIATAYKLSETALVEYKDKVLETVGEKKEQAIRDSIDKDAVEKNPPSKTEVFITGNGDTLCMDALFGRYFTSSIEKIKRAENIINKRIRDEMYVSLNEFYDELGISHIDIGDELGWNIDDRLLEMKFSSQLTEDGRPAVVFRYNVAPRYDYSNLR